MNLQHVEIVFQIIVFLFAISVHESAHAWMAWRRGDPTAYMLGRVTLNPLKHIDPFGTVLLPAICIIAGLPVFGWAKPTPVNPRNFKRPMLDDILTSVAGPASNFILVAIATVILAALVRLVSPAALNSMEPVLVFLVAAVTVNVILGIFNLIPIPPLDGSHVFRHLLPEPARRLYDTMGMVGLLILFVFGGRIIRPIANTILGFLAALIRG